ncbi:hypothetical protein T4A_10006 [Trichinella pseudospiralis]|uniref:Uncharacterized protein n=1 Tax=Trichinella pseudospiralis TaxID=6337 RepID=A0A0V1E7Y8_TRIPS|nr:hypothetical protein T4A_6917 [Trichinella pseudospiralis]KRY64821.1 hypothetical protein T4A_7883 [Trichinella pseudospiralis]KRY69426.1 hypothetical protein T4A_10006 [Trichinella pseudospiralis]
MYSDGQNANFTGHSLDKYKIVFNQTLQQFLNCRKNYKPGMDLVGRCQIAYFTRYSRTYIWN